MSIYRKVQNLIDDFNFGFITPSGAARITIDLILIEHGGTAKVSEIVEEARNLSGLDWFADMVQSEFNMMRRAA